jgi:hypothetical protein
MQGTKFPVDKNDDRLIRRLNDMIGAASSKRSRDLQHF